MTWGSSLHPGSDRHLCHYSQAGSYPTARHYERVTGAYATPSRHPSRRGDTLPLGARASGAPSPACQECLPSHTNISLNKVHCSGVILVQKHYRVYSWRVARGLPSVGARHAVPLPASGAASFRCSIRETGGGYDLYCQISYQDAPIHRNAPRPRPARARSRRGGLRWGRVCIRWERAPPARHHLPA